MDRCQGRVAGKDKNVKAKLDLRVSEYCCPKHIPRTIGLAILHLLLSFPLFPFLSFPFFPFLSSAAEGTQCRSLQTLETFCETIKHLSVFTLFL